jgi:hypothetical protein
VRRLWALAASALRRLRPDEYGHEKGESGVEVGSGEGEEEEDDDDEGEDEGDESEEEGDRAAALLDAHEIFVRSYSPTTRPWFPFHKDRSELTVSPAASRPPTPRCSALALAPT